MSAASAQPCRLSTGGRIDPKAVRVALVHSGDEILPEMAPKLRRFAARILRRRGVELVLGQRLKAATGASAILGDGTVIPTKTLTLVDKLISDSDRKLFMDALLKKCDAKDGVADGMIFNPMAWNSGK